MQFNNSIPAGAKALKKFSAFFVTYAPQPYPFGPFARKSGQNPRKMSIFGPSERIFVKFPRENLSGSQTRHRLLGYTDNSNALQCMNLCVLPLLLYSTKEVDK